MNKKNFIGISEFFIVLGLLSFAGMVFVASQSFGNGMYTASIYEEYSPLFWGLFFFSAFCGVVRVLLDVFLIRDGHRWLWGTFLLIGLTGFLLALPIFRNYAFNGQYDSVVHYSWALEIFEYGSPDVLDFYPVSHIWASTLAKSSGLTVQEAVLLMPVIIYFVGVFNIFLLAWVFDDRPEARGLIVTMSVLPIYTFLQGQFYPLQMAIYMLWLFLALFLKTRTRPSNVREVILFILVLFLLPFLHPLGVFAALASITSFFIFEFVGSQFSKVQEKSRLFGAFDKVLAPFVILFASWFTWLSGFSVFGVSIKRIYQSLVDELSGQSFTGRYTSVVERAQGGLGEIFRLIIFVHGPGLIWGGLVGVAILLMIVTRGKIRNISMFLIFPIAIFFGLGLVSLVVDIIASLPHRYINYAIALIPAFTAPVFVRYFDQARRSGRVIITCILFFAIVGAFWTGTYHIYFSKLIRSASNQFSMAQLKGYQFLQEFDSKSGRGIYSALGGAKNVFALMPYNDFIKWFQDSPNWWIRNAPAHFTYGEQPDELGYEFVNPEYLIVTAYERGIHGIGPQQSRFSSNDFLMLEWNNHWNKVYESGDFSLWVWRDE